ncbi:TonB-dependent receptor [Pusillimonas caeni]|uniref:TonB-dependent receptor domain-containing protein n=1 Tax=Pusillimonas caeni TaxID=1348472 RepID=UPI000E59D584|nr:TonB-dependent receptor [Pusillimonas caeni]TFL15489.1 TonB-dependent receptor [Pusillimonas caeni]
MKTSSRARALAALSFCIAPASLYAQSPVSQLEDIVVTPGRIAQSQAAALGDVTVIGREELAQAGQDSLAQVLSRHHGIQFADSGGPQTPTSVFLRGANANQTLVLVDGVRINSSTLGNVNWNALDPAMIERVEVLRGAASSLYGSDAIGGVVNIITRRDTGDRPLQAHGNFGVGSHGTFKTNAGVSGAQDGWNYAFSASLAGSDGYSATNPLAPFGAYHPDRDGYSQHGFSGSLGYRWRPGHHIGLTAYNSYIDGDYDNGEFSHPVHAITRQQAYTLTSTDQITDRWQSVLRFGLAKEMGDDRDPFYASTFGSLQRSYSWQNDLQLTEGQSLSLALERLEERARGSNVYQNDSRNTNSANLIWRGHFHRHHLQASVRNDNISGYGNQATGSLAYDYDIAPGWQLGLAGSTGFKAPTMSDLYGPWGSNPDLEPEKARNIEASVRYTSAEYEVGLTAYRNKVRNLIASDETYTMQNVDSATLQGVSLTASRSWGDTTVHGGYDYLDARNDDTDLRLIRRARHTYRIGAEHRLGRLALGAQYRFAGHRYDDAANTTRLGGYGLLDLTASYAFTSKVAVQVRWNNVLDKDYANAYGYNMPGSNVFVNLAVKM